MSRYPQESVSYSQDQLFAFERTKAFDEVHNIVNPDLTAIPPAAPSSPLVHMIPLDTISAAIKANAEFPNARIAVLNFASFKHPGGGFMSGMKAQEEAICHCTNLYTELRKYQDWYDSHKTKLNHGWYQNESILSQGITVYASDICKFLNPSQRFKVDILTCAAPNWSNTLLYNAGDIDKAKKATEERIKYVMHIFGQFSYDVLILGAYGCGVFKNDPFVVANAFKRCLSIPAKIIIFAIPDKNSQNYKTFERVLLKSN